MLKELAAGGAEGRVRLREEVWGRGEELWLKMDSGDHDSLCHLATFHPAFRTPCDLLSSPKRSSWPLWSTSTNKYLLSELMNISDGVPFTFLNERRDAIGVVLLEGLLEGSCLVWGKPWRWMSVEQITHGKDQDWGDTDLGLSRQWVVMVQRPRARHVRRSNRAWCLRAKESRPVRGPR